MMEGQMAEKRTEPVCARFIERTSPHSQKLVSLEALYILQDQVMLE